MGACAGTLGTIRQSGGAALQADFRPSRWACRGERKQLPWATIESITRVPRKVDHGASSGSMGTDLMGAPQRLTRGLLPRPDSFGPNQGRSEWPMILVRRPDATASTPWPQSGRISDRSLGFYTGVLGMTLAASPATFPKGRFNPVAFVGYGRRDRELRSGASPSTGIRPATPRWTALLATLTPSALKHSPPPAPPSPPKGGKVVRPPGPMKHGPALCDPAFHRRPRWLQGGTDPAQTGAGCKAA